MHVIERKWCKNVNSRDFWRNWTELQLELVTDTEDLVNQRLCANLPDLKLIFA